VSQLRTGFSETQLDGRIVGFDADFCRAIAAAVLGDAEAVAFTKLTNNERFASLTNDTVDVVFKNTARATELDTAFGIDFGPPTFFDGVQLMGREGDGFSSSTTVAGVDGAVLCTSAGTTVERILLDAFADAGASVTLNTFEDFEITTDNFVSGACDLIAQNGSTLASTKAASEPNDDAWVIFPSRQLSVEPLSPMYIENDPTWAAVVAWTVYATIHADALGVDSTNYAEQAASGRIAAKRLLGTAPNPQESLGLSNDAFLRVIAQVGNYGEIFARNLEPVGLKRAGSLNEPWSKGGLLYSPPFR
jgi:general L-amino acid transport system substrate-binding protein